MPSALYQLLLGQLVRVATNDRLHTAYKLAQEYKDGPI
jgi:hypothetical protein